jgi:hypothetical protein
VNLPRWPRKAAALPACLPEHLAAPAPRPCSASVAHPALPRAAHGCCRQLRTRGAAPLTVGCMVRSERMMQRMRDRATMLTFREQSTPEGENQWNSKPAMVTQPAAGRARGAGGQGGWAGGRVECCRLASAAPPAQPASVIAPGKAQRSTAPQPAACRLHHPPTCIGCQGDPQQSVEEADISLPCLHPRVIPVLGDILQQAEQAGQSKGGMVWSAMQRRARKLGRQQGWLRPSRQSAAASGSQARRYSLAKTITLAKSTPGRCLHACRQAAGEINLHSPGG